VPALSYPGDVEALLNWNRAATAADPAPGVAEALLEGLQAVDPARGSGKFQARREDIRRDAAKLFGFSAPERVVFTSGATHGLNQAIHAIPVGAFVVASELEHNATLRPLEAARLAGRIGCAFLGFGPDGRVQLPDLARIFSGRTESERWLFLSLASNVLGTIQPIDEVAAWCQQNGIRLVLDLSQGGGQVPIYLDRWQPTFATVAGHKGLHGPQGVGILFVGKDAPLVPLMHGGTGRHGESLDPPNELPGCFEAGTPNLPGIFALGAALRWRLNEPARLGPVRAALELVERAFFEDARVQIVPATPPPWEQRLPVLSLSFSEIPPAVIAGELAQHGFYVRAGMMCAALAPAAAGVAELGGVLRLSPPEETEMHDAERAVALLRNALDLFQPSPA
jgi:cysteine desulfurase / selenocysteine lyase